jgi:hypothetical protein
LLGRKNLYKPLQYFCSGLLFLAFVCHERRRTLIFIPFNLLLYALCGWYACPAFARPSIHNHGDILPTAAKRDVAGKNILPTAAKVNAGEATLFCFK